MRITPLDVRKQEFRRAVRGFDCEEVRAFLGTLADEYEAVLVDSKQLRERIAGQDDKIRDYEHMEKTLRDTLMTAERLMQDTRESANKEGDLIIQDSRLQARRILEECRVRTEELRSELSSLRQEKENYLARFRSLAQAQIQFIENHRTDFEDVDQRLVNMVDDVITGLGAQAAGTGGEVVSGSDRGLDTTLSAATTARAASMAPAAEAAPRPATPWSNQAPASREETPVDANQDTPGDAATPESTTAAPPADQPARNAEVDVWRDYTPHAGSKSPVPEPKEVVAASDPSEANTAQPVAEVNPWGHAPAAAPGPAPEPAPSVTDDEAVRAELAAMGIPLAKDEGSEVADKAMATLRVDRSPVSAGF